MKNIIILTLVLAIASITCIGAEKYDHARVGKEIYENILVEFDSPGANFSPVVERNYSMYSQISIPLHSDWQLFLLSAFTAFTPYGYTRDTKWEEITDTKREAEWMHGNLKIRATYWKSKDMNYLTVSVMDFGE